jgi:hypothetical protein
MALWFRPPLALSSAAVLLAFGVLATAGCSDSRRQSIEGTVTLDAQPLPEGCIKLLPTEGTPGPTAGATIQYGRFTIDAAKGTFVGRFRVEILATRPSGRVSVDPVTGEKVPVRVQYLPARYNAKSELTAEIATGGPNRLEFNLASK